MNYDDTMKSLNFTGQILIDIAQDSRIENHDKSLTDEKSNTYNGINPTNSPSAICFIFFTYMLFMFI
jgi:hypothetical protein